MKRKTAWIRHSRGLTLVESMVVVALVAILGTVASASMRGILERNRIESALHGLVGDLQFARSEAIRRGQAVSVCASADGATCAGDDRWHDGWIVFADPDASGTVPGAAALLRRHAAWAGSGHLRATAGTGALTYGRDGFLLKLDASRAVLRAQAFAGGDAVVRCLTVNRAGRQRVEPWGEEGCA